MDEVNWILANIDKLGTGACMLIAIIYFYKENTRIRKGIQQVIITEVKNTRADIGNLTAEIEKNREVFKESIKGGEVTKAILQEEVKDLKRDMRNLETSISSTCSMIKSNIYQNSKEGTRYYDHENQKMYRVQGGKRVEDEF